MKYLLILLLSSLACFAQSTNRVYIYTGFQLLPGQHALCTTSNSSTTPGTDTYGYVFNTNDTTFVAWGFPAQIVTGTNLIVDLYQLNTNTNAINYTVTVAWFKQDNAVGGTVYSTNRTFSSLLETSNTVFQTLSVTSRFTTNFLNFNTNVAYGTIKVQHASTNLPGGNAWLMGGRVRFSN